MKQDPVQVGWWVRLSNGGRGRVVWVAPHSEQGIRVEVSSEGQTIEAKKCSVVERINPYDYSLPINSSPFWAKGRTSEGFQKGEDSLGIHAADREDA